MGAVLAWGTIAYGAVLSAVFAAGGVALFGGERRVRVALTGAIAAGLGVAAWNGVLRATGAQGFAAEWTTLPASWKSAGSAVVAFAIVVAVLGLGPRASASARQVVFLALLCAVAAALVDMYLY